VTEYHKIDTLYKRDQRGQILVGEFTNPVFEYLLGNQWEWTEKVDGTNIRLSYDGSTAFRGNEHAYIAGRTDNAQIPPHLLRHLIELMQGMPWENTFETPVAVTLYGEGYGARIQSGGGKYIRDGVDFVLFDVRVGEWWLKREDVHDVAEKLGLQAVPVMNVGTLQEAIEVTREGFPSMRWAGVDRAEGLVLRPVVELNDRAGRRVITKIKHRDFR
jgi:hypothetical protein